MTKKAVSYLNEAFGSLTCFLCEVSSHYLRPLEGGITVTPIPLLPKTTLKIVKKTPQMALTWAIL